LTLGFILLLKLDDSLFFLGLIAVIFYNGFYTLWWKRNWSHAAIPGAIPGALPILMGYTSSSGNLFDPAGLYLFAVLFFWQMPHFWVLALHYQKDYAKGGFPTLPVKYGTGITLNQIIIWCLCYLQLAIIAPLFIRVKWVYLIPSFLVAAKVAWELDGFVKNPDGKKWLHFFLWVNISLIIFLTTAVADLWIIYFPISGYTR
jgi:protoheme IX farnesyltransferase